MTWLTSFLGLVLERPVHGDDKTVSSLVILQAILLCLAATYIVTKCFLVRVRNCVSLIYIGSVLVVPQPFPSNLRHKVAAKLPNVHNPGAELSVKLQVVLREGPSVDQDLSAFGCELTLRRSE